MNQKDEVFATMPVPKAVATLAIPTVLTMLVNVIYNMADTFFVGQTADPNQVAAVSLTMPVFLFLMAVGNMFGVGGCSLISRCLGMGEKEKIKNVSVFCFYGSLFAGAIVFLVFLFQMPWILSLIGTSANTYQHSLDYLKWIGMGAPLIVLSITLGNVVRGEGAAKSAMIGMMLGTVTNIILDPIMILVMEMGVEGAAIATVIGNVASLVYYLFYFKSGKSGLTISPKYFIWGGRLGLNVMVTGIPASVNNVLMSMANIITNNYLVTYGDIPVAAMGVAMKANMLTVMLQMGVAMGMQPLVGYSYGAKNYERMKAVMKFSMACNMVIGVIMTLVYFLNTRVIIESFIDNEEVIEVGIQMLRAMMISGAVLGILFVFMFSLQAMGKALASLILSLSRQGLIFLPVLILLNRRLGLDGIVYAQPVADIVAILIATVIYSMIARKLNVEK